MRNVIVIDKDLERRNFFYNILTQLNCSVTTIPSSRDLMDILNKDRPAFIVMDIASCGEDRGTVFKKIREVDRRIKLFAFLSDDMEAGKDDQLEGEDRPTYFKKDIEATEVIPLFLNVLKEREQEEESSQVSFQGRILIVEDDQDAGQLIKYYLNAKGYDSDIATNGEEALLKVRAIKPKVVLLDVRMPGMDGMLVLKHIKEIDNAIAIYIVSGLVDDELIEQATQLGAAGCLVKPLNLEKLEASILESGAPKSN